MVTGVAQLERKLTKVFPALVHERVKEAMAKAADQVVAAMKARAPVYSGPETVRRGRKHKGTPIIPGALRDSIAWTWGNAPKGTMRIGAVNQKAFTGEGSLKITIYCGGKDVFYAQWAEFGTRKWAGNPFFFGTWRNMRRRVRGMLTRAIRKAIKETGMV